MTAFVTRFDFRAPGAAPAQRQELFARGLEQASYVDRHGHDALLLSEHHGAEDGYLPDPLTVASAVAARTTRIPITVSALLVNLYDPLRLAESIAVLDHLSAGRVSYTLGLGYRREEYAMFDRPWSTRGRDIERAIGTLLAAWTGEPFEHEGRTVTVTPAPYSQPHPFLFYGGGSPAAARRAARLGLSFQPQVDDRGLRTIYLEECERLGTTPGIVMIPPTGPANVFCAEDPDAFWASCGEHLLADALAYSSWHGDLPSAVVDPSRTVDELRSRGRYVVLTPDELVAACRAKEIRAVTSHPLCAGLPEEPSWASLTLLCEQVLPRLRDTTPGSQT